MQKCISAITTSPTARCTLCGKTEQPHTGWKIFLSSVRFSPLCTARGNIKKRRCFQFKMRASCWRRENVRWLLFPAANKSWLRLHACNFMRSVFGGGNRASRTLQMFLPPSGPVDLKRDAKWILCAQEIRLLCALKMIKIVAFFLLLSFQNFKRD